MRVSYFRLQIGKINTSNLGVTRLSPRSARSRAGYGRARVHTPADVTGAKRKRENTVKTAHVIGSQLPVIGVAAFLWNQWCI